MSHDDDLERLRLAQASRGSLPAAGPGLLPSRWAGRVVSSGGSLAAGKFALVQPQTVLGTEAEGQAAAWTDTGASQPVLMLGPGVPATGDKVLVRYSADRWVSKRRGSTGGGHTACSCSGIPDTLSCSYRYLLTGGTTFKTITFNLNYNPGTISVYPGPYSVTEYWESDCIDVSDSITCGTIYPAMDICSIKFYFFCDPGNPGQFNMASDAYIGAGCTGTRYNGGGGPGAPPLAGIYDTGTRRTATCSPFFWRYPGSGTATFQVSA